jgi:hypothetical protein
MKIFTHEINDGLEEQLSSKSSISYASLAEFSDDPDVSNKPSEFKSLAGINDKDLYYTQSILVTTSWNKNDDIFDKEEVWKAKNTPIHKPTNLEHNEEIIVGHITSNWPVTEDGELIDNNIPIENLPQKYHILTGSVIYNGYTDTDLKNRAQKLIEEIEQGSKYVSMECFFKGFDYGLINKSTGEYKILGRNEETSFLTKHLRAYGGVGEYQDHKIGRVLREITFSGKGFVNKPANPESVIFTKNDILFDKTISQIEKSDDFTKIGVFSNQANLKENDMNLENEIADIKEKIEAMIDCKNSIAEAKSLASNLENKNLELQNTIKAQDVAIQEVKASFEAVSLEKEEAAKKMAEEMKKKEEEAMKMKADIDALNEVLAAYKDKEAEMMKKEKKMKRMAALIETGLDTETASTTVDKFENLDDSSFDGMAEVFAAMMKKKMAEQDMKKKEEEAMMMKKKASEDSEALENVETEDTVDLSVGSENEVSEVENTRAALVDFVFNRLGKKLNKGE